MAKLDFERFSRKNRDHKRIGNNIWDPVQLITPKQEKTLRYMGLDPSLVPNRMEATVLIENSVKNKGCSREVRDKYGAPSTWKQRYWLKILGFSHQLKIHEASEILELHFSGLPIPHHLRAKYAKAYPDPRKAPPPASTSVEWVSSDTEVEEAWWDDDI